MSAGSRLSERLKWGGVLGLVLGVVAAAVVVFELASGVGLRDVAVLIVAAVACLVAGAGCLGQWRGWFRSI